jgi:hypothetical protein
MSDIGALVERLVAAGLSVAEAGEIIATAFAAGAASSAYRKSPGAVRQEKWRERLKASQSVSTRRSETGRLKPSQSVSNRLNETLRDDPSLSLSKKEEESKERKRERRGTQLQADWRPGERAWQGAVERLGAHRAEAELGKFKNHAADKGRISKSWDAAWNNWIDRAIVYEAQNGRRKTVHDAARELHETLAARGNPFDEPIPIELRERSGTDVVRLLPAWRRE